MLLLVDQVKPIDSAPMVIPDTLVEFQVWPYFENAWRFEQPDLAALKVMAISPILPCRSAVSPAPILGPSLKMNPDPWALDFAACSVVFQSRNLPRYLRT